MGIDKEKSVSAATELRRQAEKRLCGKTVELHPPLTEEDTQRLVHELEVHQIELEMQIAELRQSRDARDKVETVLDRYTDLYDFAPVGYFTLDRNGTISAMNLSGARLLGIERARLLGRRFRHFVVDEARPTFVAFLDMVLTSRVKESCEVTLKTAANSPLFVQIEAIAFGSGRECRIALIDITGRRQAEDALSEKRLELEELNKSLEVRIAKAVGELRQKDQLLILQDRRAIMGDTINNIAHQWRQPLNTLGLIIQKLPLFYDSDKFSRKFLEENTGRGMELIQHMSQTIEDFRNFFKPDKEMVAFGVNLVIRNTLALIEESLKEQKIDVALHFEGDPMVNGYPNEYAQVLLNILMNARDAMLGRSVHDARILIHAFAEGGTSVVTISDNAGGIADEIISRLFDPYFTTKGPDKGTGIGLFMSKTIIEKSMGGRLTVRNTGNGAEFRIEV
jgi:PAS domain S-box-containing protein